MANISSANGTITLEGDWTEETINLAQKMFNVWKFEGEFGIFVDKMFPGELSTGFRGCGKWTFAGALEEFAELTEEYVKKTSYMTLEEFKTLLEEMVRLQLSIYLEFEQSFDGGVTNNTGDFYADIDYNDKYYLGYSEGECMLPESAPGIYDKIVDEFLRLAGDKATREEVEKYVDEYVALPTGYPSETILKSGFTLNALEELEHNDYFDAYGTSCFTDFYEKFRPETEAWKKFVEDFEYIGYDIEE